MKITLGWLTILLLLGWLFTGCQSTKPPSILPTGYVPILASRNPHIRGTIADITRIDEKVHGLFVDGEKEPDTTYEKASIGVDEKTVVMVKENLNYRIVTLDDLRVGQIVEVHFDGPIFLSNPVQAHADEIVIIRAVNPDAAYPPPVITATPGRWPTIPPLPTDRIWVITSSGQYYEIKPDTTRSQNIYQLPTPPRPAP